MYKINIQTIRMKTSTQPASAQKHIHIFNRPTTDKVGCLKRDAGEKGYFIWIPCVCCVCHQQPKYIFSKNVAIQNPTKSYTTGWAKVSIYLSL